MTIGYDESIKKPHITFNTTGRREYFKIKKNPNISSHIHL